MKYKKRPTLDTKNKHYTVHVYDEYVSVEKNTETLGEYALQKGTTLIIHSNGDFELVHFKEEK